MTPLAYAASVREVSVVIGALVGWRLLKEPFGARRVAGSAAVFLGITVLALFAGGCHSGGASPEPSPAVAAVPAPQPSSRPNVLTDAERAAGWRLLFDGRTTQGWRGYLMDSMPSSWQAVDGAFQIVGRGGHDIVTRDTFANFELTLEWRIAPGGNSGIFYRGSEDDEAVYWNAPEMQVLDDSGHSDGRLLTTSAGAVFGLYPVPRHLAQPAGQWNQVRILVNGAHVEHWLNGVKTAEYEFGSADWDARVRASKFAPHPHFGRNARGFIALQDHGGDDHPAYRNIKIRVLP